MKPIKELTKETLADSKMLEMVRMITGIRVMFNYSNHRLWLNPEKGTISMHKDDGIGYFKLQPVYPNPNPATTDIGEIFIKYESMHEYNQWFRSKEDAIMHFMAFWARGCMYDSQTSNPVKVTVKCPKCDHAFNPAQL